MHAMNSLAIKLKHHCCHLCDATIRQSFHCNRALDRAHKSLQMLSSWGSAHRCFWQSLYCASVLGNVHDWHSWYLHHQRAGEKSKASASTFLIDSDCNATRNCLLMHPSLTHLAYSPSQITITSGYNITLVLLHALTQAVICICA